MEEAGVLRETATANKKQEVQRLQEQMLERADERAALLEAERKEDLERIKTNETEQYEVSRYTYLGVVVSLCLYYCIQ